MNPWLLGLVLGTIGGGVATWLTLRPASRSLGNDAERYDSVTISRPPVWTRMATVMTLAPLVGVARVLTEPDPTDALFFAALMIIACGVGASVFIPARRKIVFSKRGIEVIGVPRLVMRWVDVDAIDVPEGALLGSMQFKNANGRKIGVDATMVGWPQLIKRLPDLCADEATNKVTDALAKLR